MQISIRVGPLEKGTEGKEAKFLPSFKQNENRERSVAVIMEK